jgi:acrylyl-CoA reductase (NADPH)
MFRALLLEKDADGVASALIKEMDDSSLPAGEVTVAVEYSTVNYKDGLCLSATGGGLVLSTYRGD